MCNMMDPLCWDIHHFHLSFQPGYACSWRIDIPWRSLHLWSTCWNQVVGIHWHCRSQSWIGRWKGCLSNNSSWMLTCTLLLGWIAFMISTFIAAMSAWCDDDPPLYIYISFFHTYFNSPLLSSTFTIRFCINLCHYYACTIYCIATT